MQEHTKLLSGPWQISNGDEERDASAVINREMLTLGHEWHAVERIVPFDADTTHLLLAGGAVAILEHTSPDKVHLKMPEAEFVLHRKPSGRN